MGFLDRLFSPGTPPPPPEKAATGRGVSMMTGGVHLFSMADSPERKAQEAQALARANPWIRTCERVISQRIGRAEWHLEMPDGEHVGPDSPPAYQAVLRLLEKPYTPREGDAVVASPQFRSDLWTLTMRHEGVVGYGFWYLVGIEALAGTPSEILYVNPGRVVPALNDNGALIGWVMDPHGQNPVKFTVRELVPFNLEPPDQGFLSAGLVESAIAKAEITRLADRHAQHTLATGGRLPGIYSPPKDVGGLSDTKHEALVRDLRTIADLPDATKRSLVLQGPMDFTPTAVDPSKLLLTALAEMGQEGILALWGVPKSQIGMDAPAGLNSGGTKAYDEAVLWQNACAPRVESFSETVQYAILDRFREFGIEVRLEIEGPEFDDDMPSWDMAVKSREMPMRNVERRALVGLPPFGDPVLDNQVLLPVGMTPYADAPEEPSGEAATKASLPRDARAMARALSRFLREQGERIGTRIERNAAHLQRKPGDTTVWWDEKAENEALAKVLKPFYAEVASGASRAASRRVTGKAVGGPGEYPEAILRPVLGLVGRRVVQVNDTTRNIVRDLVEQAVTLGMPMPTLGRVLRGVVPPLEGDANAWLPVINGAERTFASELRGETIARTEMRVAQTGGNLAQYQELGVETVRMIDGDEDEVCAARDGREVPIEEAWEEMMQEHPNGTLDFVPVVARALRGMD